MTSIEQSIVVRLAEQEPAALLALLAGCLAPQVAPVSTVVPLTVQQTEKRRAGEDPFLIDEEEFSRRAQYMTREEQTILRCRVNAARAYKKGYPDHARRYRQRADRLEKKLNAL